MVRVVLGKRLPFDELVFELSVGPWNHALAAGEQ